jgi:hypothetical protein
VCGVSECDRGASHYGLLRQGKKPFYIVVNYFLVSLYKSKYRNAFHMEPLNEIYTGHTQ